MKCWKSRLVMAYGPAWFNLPSSGPRYVVVENDQGRAMGFHSLLAALRLCLAQRGAEWPEDGAEDD
jgi:hypothetical protein